MFVGGALQDDWLYRALVLDIQLSFSVMQQLGRRIIVFVSVLLVCYSLFSLRGGAGGEDEAALVPTARGRMAGGFFSSGNSDEKDRADPLHFDIAAIRRKSGVAEEWGLTGSPASFGDFDYEDPPPSGKSAKLGLGSDVSGGVTPVSEVRSRLLEELLGRFGPEDFRRGLLIHGATPPRQTRARDFVYDALAKDFATGKYLYTAYELLHRLYVGISSGDGFDLHEELGRIASVVDDSSVVLPLSREFIDTKIGSDRAFVDFISLEYLRLSLGRFEDAPEDVITNFGLLLKARMDLSDSTDDEKIAKLIRRLCLRASPGFRSLLVKRFGVSALRRLEGSGEASRRGLAELFAVIAADRLIERRFGEAGAFFLISKGIEPRLSVQGIVERYLVALGVSGAKSVEVARPEKPGRDRVASLEKAGRELFGRINERLTPEDAPPRSDNGVSGLFVAILILFIALCAVVVFRIFRALPDNIESDVGVFPEGGEDDEISRESITRVSDGGSGDDWELGGKKRSAG